MRSALLLCMAIGIPAQAIATTPHIEYPEDLIEPLEYLEDALRPSDANARPAAEPRYACFVAVSEAKEALSDLIFAMQFTFWRDGTGHYKGEPWDISHEYYCELHRETYVDRPREATRALSEKCMGLDSYRKVAIARREALEEARRVVKAGTSWCAEMYRRREHTH
jgi:hypothetical protein